jgi:O-antigen/teichoic acid export membrane protein
MYIPIALNYMGVEKYGVWVVILSIINYLNLANFGIPTAVTNLISQSNDQNEKVGLLLKGFKILIIGCLIILSLGLLAFLAIINYTSWTRNLSTEIQTASILLVLFYILRIPFQVSSASFIANKKVYLTKIYDFLAVAITFLSLLLTIYLNQTLIFLSLISGILLLSLNILSLLHAVKVLNVRNYTASITSVSSKDIYRPGLGLLAAGLGSLIVWNTDNIIISKFLGFEEVAAYSTAFRMFSFGYMSFGLIHALFIPYYGESYKNKSWERLQMLFNINLLGLPLVAACVWLLGWLFAKDIIFLWLGSDRLYAGSTLYFILGAYGLVLACAGVMFNLLTSLNLLKALFYLTVAEAVLNLCASVYLVKIFGYNGVAFGTLVGSIVVPLLCLPYLIQKSSKLEIAFPYRSFINSLIVYGGLLSLLFFVEADQYTLEIKFSISVFCMVSLILIQFILNRQLVKEVYRIINLGFNSRL